MFQSNLTSFVMFARFDREKPSGYENYELAKPGEKFGTKYELLRCWTCEDGECRCS